MILEFPEFLPDLPALNNPGMTLVKNAIPGGASYKSFPQYTAYSNALNAYCRGAFSAREPQVGTTFNFAGTATKLYGLGLTSLGVYDDISKVGGYSLAAEENWAFTQYGDTVIAVSINAPTQKFQMGVDTRFADLSGAPQARYCTTVRDDFLVLANTYDAVDGYRPQRVRWAGIGTTTSWTVSSTTQADYQDLNGGNGWIMNILGGQYGVIFQEKAITRMDYIGSPEIFQFNTIEINQGTKYPRSCIRVGDLSFFIGLDGFRVFDGNQSIQIGADKVDAFFFDDLDTTYDYLIASAVDYKNHLVMWAYPSQAVGGAINSRILMYNYAPNATKRWSYADINTELIYTALSEGYTLDELDQWQIDHKDAGSSTASAVNLDRLPYSLDSRVWVGNNIELGFINSDHKLALASTSAALTAVLETAEAQITDGQKTDVLLIRPAISGSTASTTVQIGTRNLQSESVTWGSAITVDSDGNFQARSNARFHRMRVNISSNFTHAIGVEVLDFKAAGYR